MPIPTSREQGSPFARFGGLGRWLALLLLFCALGAASPILAQGSESGFTGRVVDLAYGRPIAGATIRVGKASTASDREGRYRLVLPPGIYSLRAEAAGFIGMSQTLQRVQAGNFTTVDFAMVPESPSAEEASLIEAKLLVTEQPSPDVSILGPVAEEAKITSVPRAVRVLMPDDTVVVMEMDEYLKGVVPHEMPPFWPMEALKAQAVAARTYAATAKKFPEKGADVDTTTRTQVWSPTHYDTSDQAVMETHGQGIIYDGGLIRAFFFARCDGRTRSSEEVWGGYLPYLRSVLCTYHSGPPYGHGVGMCQWGAQAYARHGYDWRRILTHYYTGVGILSPSPPQLLEASVSPASGSAATPFLFRVTYRDEDGDVPQVADLFIDGRAFPMNRVSGDPRSGARYEYRATLSPGQHSYSFSFRDEYGGRAEAGPFQGPRVSTAPTPIPTPIPSPERTQAGGFRQTTLLDFTGGSFVNVTLVGPSPDVSLALVSGASEGIYTSKPLTAEFSFIALAINWEAEPAARDALEVQLRTSADGRSWSEWTAVPEADIEPRRGRLTWGELVFLPGRVVQYRVLFTSDPSGARPQLDGLTITYIEARPGPTAAQARASAEGEPPTIPRSGWGADESLMTWPPEHRTIRKFILHHTATSNQNQDPAAVIRAIYYYHAVTRDWGDIGYNFLIDRDGNIYEGRYGGDGVVGGHAERYNWGSIGVALLGDFSATAPLTTMRAGLAKLVAWKGNLHFVHPLGSGFFIDRDLPNVMGHRDSLPTACPGDSAYGLLSQILNQAYAEMLTITPSVVLSSPPERGVVRGSYEVQVQVSPAVTRVDYYLDGALAASRTASPFSWTWNTTTAREGERELRAVARTAAGQEKSSSRRVIVDNLKPSGALAAPSFINTLTATLSLTAQDAVQMQFSNGWFWEGEALPYEVGEVVADGAAYGGRAWRARAGIHSPGRLYGPYTYALPAGKEYRAYFRLKVASNGSTQEVARLDVVDNLSHRVYGALSLRGTDFSTPNSYQEFWIDFNYQSAGTAGLEFRVAFKNVTDLWVDRVAVFSAPQPFATQTLWRIPEGEGSKVVAARYLDLVDNLSPPYLATTILDLTPPQWLGWSGQGAQVRDTSAGLAVSRARFSFSSDGGRLWSEWLPADCSGAEGSITPQEIRPRGFIKATHLRFSIEDRAGNHSESPAYAVPLTPLPTPRGSSPNPTTTPPSGASLSLDIALAPGWNAIGLPSGSEHSAESLLREIEAQGGQAQEVMRWQDGAWTVHPKGLSLNNFTLRAGEGYFVRAAVPSTLRLWGQPTRELIPIPLAAGWNLISIPHPSSIQRAKDLAAAIGAQGGACQEIARWQQGAWTVHLVGRPFNDFPIVPGEGYFVRCTVASTFSTPPR